MEDTFIVKGRSKLRKTIGQPLKGIWI